MNAKQDHIALLKAAQDKARARSFLSIVNGIAKEATSQGYLIEAWAVTSAERACVLSYTGSGNAQPWVVHDFSVNSGGFFTGDYFASRENAFARFEERAGRAY